MAKSKWFHVEIRAEDNGEMCEVIATSKKEAAKKFMKLLREGLLNNDFDYYLHIRVSSQKEYNNDIVTWPIEC